MSLQSLLPSVICNLEHITNITWYVSIISFGFKLILDCMLLAHIYVYGEWCMSVEKALIRHIISLTCEIFEIINTLSLLLHGLLIGFTIYLLFPIFR